MSVVTVQVGQCGNQIGRQLFSTLREDALARLNDAQGRRGASAEAYYQTSSERFFVQHDEGVRRRGGGSGGDAGTATARAVLVDMEPKVVQGTLQEASRSGQWRYDAARCVFTRRSGSGNNWARGYFRLGAEVVESVLDMIQTQAERCDRLDAFLVLMSAAGGTGAGLGSHLTERLSDRYRSAAIVNQVVWPYATGEVIVQDYNALLTLSHLQRCADAIIISPNDHAHKVCSKLLHLNKISFSDLNSVISHSLASILQPAIKHNHLKHIHNTLEDPLLHSQCTFQDISTTLCPLQDFKLLSLKSVPMTPDRSHDYNRHLWPGLIRHLHQMLITDAATEDSMNWGVSVTRNRVRQKSLYSYNDAETTERVAYAPTGVNRSVANLVVMRGSEVETANVSPFLETSLYARWSPQESVCSVWGSGHTYNKYERSCTLLTNSQSCVSLLDRACGRGWQMFSSRAYLYQYMQNGLSDDDFYDCFENSEHILKMYASL